MNSFQDHRLRVPATCSGQRLDHVLAMHLPLSKRYIRRCIDNGGAYINRRRVRKAGRSCKSGDRLRLVTLDGESLNPFNPGQIVWRGEDIFLLHKKSGQYSQEALHRSRGTLPLELAEYLTLTSTAAKNLRPVHRLDRETSGLLLICGTTALYGHLQKHWAKCVEKTYLAVVEPVPSWQEQRVDLPISSKRDAMGRYQVDKNGRACITDIELLETRDGRALLKIRPKTGRSHQLRVHLSSIGHPILGDTRYGGETHSRMMLHAYGLTVHPPALSQKYYWTAEPEEDWKW
ncbi:MAG: pseudouridine synthase [Mariprofundaceae bacterium]